MRPLRFLLLLFIFVALPIALTCWSLLASSESAANSFQPGYNPRASPLRALFSFSTPSSLFPPSAVISLTNDNSTFFLARPAAFGPSLPSRGLSGELWVGKGFGDDALLQEENIHVVGWELGCSDVPGWGEEESKRIHNLHPVDQNHGKVKVPRNIDPEGRTIEADLAGTDPVSDGSPFDDDGTDDYLHHPLSDSNPATPAQPGEPANVDQSDKNKKATHADIQSLQESADIAGKIVMLSRGGCGFLEKVKWAQRRGGVALIVGDNEKGAQLTIMYAKGDTSNVTIPALFTSYTSAHLLSSLVPSESADDGGDGNVRGGDKPTRSSDSKQQDHKPVFTSTKSGTRQPTPFPRGDTEDEREENWVKKMLSAVGLSENSPFSHPEDSRRPPSSGNIDWVLLEDWDDEASPKSKHKANTVSSVATMSTSSLKVKATSLKRPGGDDFVIGVQDWRDTDLVAPRPTTSAPNPPVNAQAAADTATIVTTSDRPEATLKGGSITPGSGEYDHDRPEHANRLHRGHGASKQQSDQTDTRRGQGSPQGSWFDFFRSDRSTMNDAVQAEGVKNGKENKRPKEKIPESTTQGNEAGQEGLWVTLTPTSVSASPFFDTLLVLVVSPLVTLTVVYALLLLRSRIRRRRWRAPKSVVERLPVRTYHTMSTTSSTTSSQLASPDNSSPMSPLLISASQNVSQRPRPRSQTTPGVFPGGSTDSQLSHSRSPQTEKPASKYTKRKRYTGRQVECVVCLEDYIDGESRVMSLPCGHEFHAECITPWLVTRRRTCPICKGDVVRSLARSNSALFDEDFTEDEQTSDDMQSRVAQTTNDEPSAAIPIPTSLHDEHAVDVDEDVERGRDVEIDDRAPLLGSPGAQQQERERQSIWRNIVSASVSRLSGDTLWRQTPVDRNR